MKKLELIIVGVATVAVYLAGTLAFRRWRTFILTLMLAVTSTIFLPVQAQPVSTHLPDVDFTAAVTAANSMPRLYSILVSWHGQLILEKYFNNSGPDKQVNIKSASKSVLSALVGIAIEQGALQIDQTIETYLDGLLQGDLDERKKQITIADLLSMQSGLETTSNRNYGAWVLSSNWTEFALKQPMTFLPGTVMQYSSGNTHLLSAILTIATGQSTLEFARDVLGKPMGFHLNAWPRSPEGIYFGGNDMEMTARQMLKFGELYLNEGVANGKQVVPAEWVSISLQRHARSMREHGRFYGYGWWIRDMAGFETPYAWGYGGQFIILVPELELGIVTTSASTPDANRRGHRQHIQQLVEEFIIMPVAEQQQRIRRVRTN